MIYDFKNKDLNLRNLNAYMLAKTLPMFEWFNLPDTIPARELEYLLQVNGYAFIHKVNGELYAFAGAIGGKVDAYNRPLDITINNIYLNYNKTVPLTDGVLISNDDMMLGLIPMYNRYNFMLAENDINMILHGYNTRIQTIISASDDKTKQNAEKYMKKIIEGEVGIIGDNAMFDGVKVQGSNSGHSSSITSITEFQQYQKASLYNEIGLAANFNMKRERLTSGEVEQGDDSLFPFVYSMLNNRVLAVEQVNNKFDLTIDVDFGSVWHTKERELVDGVVQDDLPASDVNEPLDEPLTNHDEPLDEPLTNHDEPLEIPITEIEQASKIDEIMELLTDDTLSDDDIKAIDELLNEIKDKDNAKNDA